MFQFIPLLAACLLVQGVHSIADSACTMGVYSSLVALVSDLPAAQSYCSSNYPVTTITITVQTKKHNHKRHNHKDHFRSTISDTTSENSATVTPSSPTTANTHQKRSVWKKVLEDQPDSVIDQLCTCIESQQTATVTAKHHATSHKPDGSDAIDADISTSSPIESEATSLSSTDPASTDLSSSTDSSSTDSSNTDSSSTDSSSTDSSSTDSSSTDSSSTDSSNTNSSSTDSSTNDSANTGSSDSSGTDTSDSSSTDSSTTDSSDTDALAADSSATFPSSTSSPSVGSSTTNTPATASVVSSSTTIISSTTTTESTIPPDVTCQVASKGDVGGGCPNGCYCDQSATNGLDDPGVCDDNNGSAGLCSAEDPTCPDGSICIVYDSTYYCAVYSDCLPTSTEKMFARDGLMQGFGYRRMPKRTNVSDLPSRFSPIFRTPIAKTHKSSN